MFQVQPLQGSQPVRIQCLQTMCGLHFLSQPGARDSRLISLNRIGVALDGSAAHRFLAKATSSAEMGRVEIACVYLLDASTRGATALIAIRRFGGVSDGPVQVCDHVPPPPFFFLDSLTM